MKPNTAKLQRLINNATAANNAVHHAEKALYEYAHKIWEFDSFDDNIIDSCLGGCGLSNGMSAQEFIATMESNNGN